MTHNGLQIQEPRRFYVRLNPAAASSNGEFRPVLDHLAATTGADGAVVYRFIAESDEFHAVATRTDSTPKIADLGVTFSVEASDWLRKSSEPLQISPVENTAFENVPEGLQFGFQRLLLIPLRGEHDTVGFLTLGRKAHSSFTDEAIGIAQPLARLVAAVLERDELQRAMKERKLVERAKGIVQRRERISEENAYLMMRNTSRRRRIALAELAREIIESSVRRAA